MTTITLSAFNDIHLNEHLKREIKEIKNVVLDLKKSLEAMTKGHCRGEKERHREECEEVPGSEV